MDSQNDNHPRVAMLVDEQLCTWRERDIALQDRGVRLGWLISFVESIYTHERELLVSAYREQCTEYDRAMAQQKASDWFPERNILWVEAVLPKEPRLVELTTRAFVAEFIIPLTESLKLPFYARVPESERGRPTVFLSHAWDTVLLAGIPATGFQKSAKYGTLDAFNPHGIAGVKEEYVWIDFVCYNQHKIADENIAFDMESIVKSIGKVAFAVTPVPLFDRIWCLWELLSMSHNNCSSQFCAAPGYRTEKRLIVNNFLKAFKGVASTRATKSQDYDKLLAAIVSHFGSTEAADIYIMNLMKGGMVHTWFELYSEYRQSDTKKTNNRMDADVE